MQQLVRRPAVVLGLLAVISLGLALGLPRLTTRLDLLALHASITGTPKVDPVVLVALPDPVSPAVFHAVAEQVGGLSGVTEVRTLAVPDDAPPAVAERLATATWGRADARPAVVRATLDAASPSVLARLEEVASAHGGAVLGLPVLDEAHRKLVVADTARLLALVGLVFTLVLAVLWRRPAAALVPIVAVAVGVGWLLGLLGWACVPLGGPLLALVPLVVVLGLTDAVHVAWHLAALPDREPARVARTLLEVGRACAFTSATTAAGMLALLVTEAPVLHRFGVWGAVGTGLVLGSGVVLPAALILQFPGLTPRPRRFSLRAPRVSRPVALFAIVVLLGVLAGGARVVDRDLSPGGDLPADHPVLQRHLAHDEALGGLHPLRVVVTPRSPEGTRDPDGFVSLVAVHRAAVNHPAVGSVVSLADAALLVGRASGRTVDRIAGRPGDRRPGRRRRYQRVRERSLEAAAAYTTLPLDDGEGFTLHLRLHHVPASQWADLLREMRRAGGSRVRTRFDGYPVQVVRARARLVRDGRAVFGLAGGVALGCLVLLTGRLHALVAGVLVAVSGLAVLAGLAILGVPLSHANLFALSIAVGLAIDPWIHLAVGHPGAGPPVVVGQALLGLGLGLLATSAVPTLAGVGPVLAGAVALSGTVTALLWVSGGSRAAAPRAPWDRS